MSDERMEGATHVWVPPDINISIPGVTRLSAYRLDEDGNWEVFSHVTGWRLSQNSHEWFIEETQKGYFKEI